jgi:hypothetical protein
VDEIKLFGELKPPPPASAPRMRDAARARLTAATSAPQSHPAMRRSTVVTVAAAAALVAGGTSYGLTAGQGGLSGSKSLPATAAGLTAVRGCPGKYITAGTLEKVSGTRAMIEPRASAHLITVATSSSTVINRPVTAAVSDITDGSRVVVTGIWSGRSLAATHVGIEEGLPAPGFLGGLPPRHARKVRNPPQPPKGAPTVTGGTVVDVHDGSFTVLLLPIPGGRRIQVTTSDSTKVMKDATASLSQLNLGANVVAVGRLGPHGSLRASTVTEPAFASFIIGRGLVRLRPWGCSASAITTAAILAGG